jgi:adenosylcobinamide-phosphate synthase
MTAVYLHQAQAVTLRDDELTLAGVVTAGLSNPASPGLSPAAALAAGTINIILLVDAQLTPAAMVNAVITATETKTQLLLERGVRTPEGNPATGTSTDAVVVACTGRGDPLPYAGPATLVGWLIGRHAICLALLLDLILGDPANRFHPVAWMGTVIGTVRRRAPGQGWLAQLSFGALLVTGGAVITAGLGRLLAEAVARLPSPIGWVVEAGLLMMTFSLRGLINAAEEVEGALEVGDLTEARRVASWHLVSRDTTALSESQVAAATIESVAENISDGVVAPLFYYALGGLPVALAYRFVNTADAMLGYRDPAHEWLGKAPARLDDLANLLPARISTALIVLAAALVGENPRMAWQVWQRDAAKTASPNAGHPMSAMAGALGVELEKVGHYRLGAGGRPPASGDIRRAARLIYLVPMLIVGLLVLLPFSKSNR